MRIGFGLIGLLLALAIVAMLLKKQSGVLRLATPPVVSSPAVTPASDSPPGAPQAQQLRQQVESLLQQPRPMPED
jgi:hypothetical protein